LCYHFLTHGALTAVQQHALVKEAIIRLHDIGVTVRAIVCDGTSANIATLEMFRGCHLPDTPWFEHPRLDAVRIFATLDAFFNEAEEYFRGLTNLVGRPIVNSRLRTFVIGFISGMKSIIGLAHDMFDNQGDIVSYILPYRLC
jgi:hypothetical protein